MLELACCPGGGGGSGGGPPWIFFIGMIVVGVVSLFARQMWRLNRWRYANPDAMQPSSTYFTVERIFGGILIVGGVVGLIVVLAIR